MCSECWYKKKKPPISKETPINQKTKQTIYIIICYFFIKF